jgi:hypothetical protein
MLALKSGICSHEFKAFPFPKISQTMKIIAEVGEAVLRITGFGISPTHS